MKTFLKKILNLNENENQRKQWLKQTLSKISAGKKILDVGAGELKNKNFCLHLNYVSQDLCEYNGLGNKLGAHTDTWDTSKIDIVSDIINIPEPNASYDVILCSEVLEHIPDPLKALDELHRLLKIGGVLIITAPFSSNVHFAPQFHATGFSQYWYEYHLPKRNMKILELVPNGDWFSLHKQFAQSFPMMAMRNKDWCWIFAFIISFLSLIYHIIRNKNIKNTEQNACLGFHSVSKKLE
jgi:ubiquinone/menaquinone biosynthesis C-methylase UbiE